MKTFLQFIENIASHPPVGGHDPANPFKSRFNPTHGKYEVVHTDQDRVLSLHDTEDAAKNHIKSMKEAIAYNDNSPPGVIDRVANDNKSLAKRKANDNTTKKEIVTEVSPPGWKGTTEAMKKHKDITNPWALSWWMANKGYKSHQTEPKK